MTEIDIDVRVGGKLPVTVAPTSTDTTILQGAGRLAGWSLRDVNATAPNAASGNAVAPAAAQTIVSLVGLAAGTYTVQWTVGLQGAAAAADADNFQFRSGAGLNVASVNPGAAGEYPQVAIETTVGPADTMSIIAIGAGTAGVTYAADISITPMGATNTVCELIDGNNVIAEIAFGPNVSDTVDFGDGIKTQTARLTLHVVSGTVTGAVYVIPSRGSQ